MDGKLICGVFYCPEGVKIDHVNPSYYQSTQFVILNLRVNLPTDLRQALEVFSLSIMFFLMHTVDNATQTTNSD